MAKRGIHPPRTKRFLETPGTSRSSWTLVFETPEEVSVPENSDLVEELLQQREGEVHELNRFERERLGKLLAAAHSNPELP